MSANHNAPLMPPHTTPTSYPQRTATLEQPPPLPERPQQDRYIPTHPEKSQQDQYIPAPPERHQQDQYIPAEQLRHGTTQPQRSGTTTERGFNKLRKGSQLINGMGETLRGNLLAMADEAGGNHVAAEEKRRRIVDRGEEMIRAGMGRDPTGERYN